MDINTVYRAGTSFSVSPPMERQVPITYFQVPGLAHTAPELPISSYLLSGLSFFPSHSSQLTLRHDDHSSGLH